MNDYDSTALGCLVGLSSASSRNKMDYLAAKESLRRSLPSAVAAIEAKILAAKAQRAAMEQCIDASVTELQALAEGKTISRRHSDPNQIKNQNEDFVDTAEDHLHRMSSGKLGFSEESKSRKKARTLPGAYGLQLISRKP